MSKFFDPNARLPKPEQIRLPIDGGRFDRAPEELRRRFEAVSTATASALLDMMGISRTFISGPRPLAEGHKLVGSAITLQFMPQREDIASGARQEDVEATSALWAVLEDVRPGDVLVIQAYGDTHTGCVGEMLLTSLKGRGGVGVIVDGCIRDWPKIREMELPVWALGVTPNYASQSRLFPWAHAVPIACSDVLVLPGDIIVADDDGAICVPVNVAELLLDVAERYEGAEDFIRMRLAEGGELRTYYPITPAAEAEYEHWQSQRNVD